MFPFLTQVSDAYNYSSIDQHNPVIWNSSKKDADFVTKETLLVMFDSSLQYFTAGKKIIICALWQIKDTSQIHFC